MDFIVVITGLDILNLSKVIFLYFLKLYLFSLLTFFNDDKGGNDGEQQGGMGNPRSFQVLIQ